MTERSGVLPPPTRRVHRALLDGFIATGEVPAEEAWARAADVPVRDLPVRLAELAEGDYVGLDATGRLTCLYPFSAVATPHVVVLGAGRRWAMCSIDALGVAAMIGRPVTVEGRCALCGSPIRLAVSPGTVTEAEPSEAVVVARRSGDEPAGETCCPFTLFACSPAHGEAIAARSDQTTVAPLAEALQHAESIFGGFLGETLPAQRPRSRQTTVDLRT